MLFPNELMKTFTASRANSSNLASVEVAVFELGVPPTGLLESVTETELPAWVSREV